MKLSTMPFEAISALSRSPELLRQCARAGLAALLLALAPAVPAQEVPAAPTVSDGKNSTPQASPGERGDRDDRKGNFLPGTSKRTDPRGDLREESKSVTPSGEKSGAPASKPAPGVPSAPPSATAKREASPSPRSYDAFRVVAERNIFDANRTSRTRSRSDEDAPPAPKVESFALVGTMAYDRNQLAFFDSSNPAYRRTAKAGDTLGVHKVKQIGASQVTLETGGQEVTLKIGMQLRRENEGPWEAGLRPETFAASAPSPGGPGGDSGDRRPSFGGGDPRSSRSSRSSRGPGDRGGERGGDRGGPPPGFQPPSPPPSGGGDSAGNDLIRRLMEQRQKEINR